MGKQVGGWLRLIALASVPLAACDSSDSTDDKPDAGDAAISVDAAEPDAYVAPIACVDGVWNQNLGTPEVRHDLYQTQAASATVRLHSSTLDSRKATELSSLSSMRAHGAFLVTLYAPRMSPDRLRAALQRIGIAYVEPVARGFHIALVSRTADLNALAASREVSSVHALQPEDKLLMGLLALTEDERVKMDVERVDASGATHAQTRVMSLSQARVVASQADVLRVARNYPQQVLLDTQRIATRTDEVHQFSLVDGLPHYAGLSGRGIVVALTDTGVDDSHPDFHAHSPTGEDLGSRVVGALTPSSDGYSHGSIVAGMIGGSGWNSEGMVSRGTHGTPFLWRGIAPEVERIVSSRLNEDFAPWITAFINGHALVSNHSHTQSAGEYAPNVFAYDLNIRNGASNAGMQQPPRPMVFAAGNNGVSQTFGYLRGYYSIVAPSKNTITVGATQCNDDIVAPDASKGPALDGRLKPDLVAPSYKDYRPLDGVYISVDEVRLHARDGSSASDLVWTMDDDGSSSGFSSVGELSSGGTRADGVISARTHASTDDGVDWASIEGIEASDYDRASMRVKMTINGSAPRTLWPMEWRIRWGSEATMNFTQQASVDYAPGQVNDTWTEYAVDLSTQEHWTGTIRKFRWAPTVYTNGGATGPSVGGTYGASGGTSMAAPIVTGVVALMMQRLRDDHAVDFVTAPPYPSTFRSLLVHTSRDLVRTGDFPWRETLNPDLNAPIVYHEGPDFASGYGIVDTAAVIALIDAHDEQGARRWTEQSIAQDEIHVWTFQVEDSSAPLKATIAWDDLPASTMIADTEKTLVNDLDIVLIDPNNEAHSPWLLDPLPFDINNYRNGYDPITQADIKPARQCVIRYPWLGELTLNCEDHRNNLEQVYVAAPMTGTWRIYVRGHAVIPDQTQHYSLVMSQSCASMTP